MTEGLDDRYEKENRRFEAIVSEIPRKNVPVFRGPDDKWLATEENVLLMAVQGYGYGNWTLLAKILTKALKKKFTPEEVCDHYKNTYLEGDIAEAMKLACSKIYRSSRVDHTCTEDDELTKIADVYSYEHVSPEHLKEIGYMPLRQQFSVEYENESEELITNLSCKTEDEYDKNIALIVLDAYLFVTEYREKLKKIVLEQKIIEQFFASSDHEMDENSSDNRQVTSLENSLDDTGDMLFNPNDYIIERQTRSKSKSLSNRESDTSADTEYVSDTCQSTEVRDSDMDNESCDTDDESCDMEEYSGSAREDDDSESVTYEETTYSSGTSASAEVESEESESFQVVSAESGLVQVVCAEELESIQVISEESESAQEVIEESESAEVESEESESFQVVSAESGLVQVVCAEELESVQVLCAEDLESVQVVSGESESAQEVIEESESAEVESEESESVQESKENECSQCEDSESSDDVSSVADSDEDAFNSRYIVFRCRRLPPYMLKNWAFLPRLSKYRGLYGPNSFTEKAHKLGYPNLLDLEDLTKNETEFCKYLDVKPASYINYKNYLKYVEQQKFRGRYFRPPMVPSEMNVAQCLKIAIFLKKRRWIRTSKIHNMLKDIKIRLKVKKEV